MDMNQMTEKSLEALREAQGLAATSGQQAVEDVHLFAALMHAKEGLVPEIFASLGKSAETICREADALVDSLPKIGGSGYDPDKIYLSAGLDAVLRAARCSAHSKR